MRNRRQVKKKGNNLSREGEEQREGKRDREEEESGYSQEEVRRYFALRARLIIDRGKFPPRAHPIINYN